MSELSISDWTILLTVQLLAIAIIDWKWQIIPNYLNSGLGLTGLVHAYDGDWRVVLYSVLAYVLVLIVFWSLTALYFKLRGQHALGLR